MCTGRPARMLPVSALSIMLHNGIIVQSTVRITQSPSCIQIKPQAPCNKILAPLAPHWTQNNTIYCPIIATVVKKNLLAHLC